MKKFDLPKDWSWKALGECCKIVNGSTPKRSNKKYWGGSIAWVTPTEVGKVGGKYIDDSEEKITKEGYESCSTTLLPENSVIYSSRASIGHIAINEAPVCTNQGFKSFVTGDGVDPEYLYYCLQWKTPEIEHIAEGSTYTEISKRDMSKVEIPLPPLDVQRRIVTVLDRADALRKKRSKTINRTDDLLDAAFLDLFGDPVTNPKGWQTKRLGDCISMRNGKRLSAKERVENGDCHVYGGNGYVGNHNEYKYEEPKIVIGRVGAYCGNVRRTPERVWVTDNAIVVTEIDGNLIEPFLLPLLQKLKLGRFASKSGQALISQTRISDIDLIIPSRDLQEKYARQRKKVETIRYSEADALQGTNNLFDSLLQRAFLGELDLHGESFGGLEGSASTGDDEGEGTQIAEQKALFD